MKSKKARTLRRSSKSAQHKESCFLLATLAQAVLCAVMLSVAFALSSLMGMTALKTAFAHLTTSEGQAMEVVAVVASMIHPSLALGQGGENPIVPDSIAAVALSAKARAPVQGVRSSSFGLRSHPITGKADFHTGLDLAAPAGTPIWAAYPGRVIEVGESAIYGNFVVLDHGGITTRYCHCSEILVTLGLQLRQGEKIALVGSTGISTGPHLHFEVRRGDTPLDPAYAL